MTGGRTHFDSLQFHQVPRPLQAALRLLEELLHRVVPLYHKIIIKNINYILISSRPKMLIPRTLDLTHSVFRYYFYIYLSLEQLRLLLQGSKVD